MLEHIDLENILFLDIETVPQSPDFGDLDEDFQELWEHKSKWIREKQGMNLAESYDRAGIYSEFGKIICISVGYLRQRMGDRMFRMTSFYGHDEHQILAEFADLLESRFDDPQTLLCAHNGKEFDFPYIARRMIINGIRLPRLLNIAGKKPWEVAHLDTMELWKFGDYKHYTSIKLLTKVLGIPTPKDDIDGSMVGSVYWEDKDLDRIERYCRKDVLAVAQVMLKYRGEELLSEDMVVEV
ncbi:MAG: 3'-5' exonuclease [Flavobacteriales bacterium]|nr:3'-5' exonuclease [Flavobacteriales bacterium]